MIKLHFNTPDEFETLFKSRDIRVTNAIVQSIKEAMQKNKRTAKMFEVSFENTEFSYEINLPMKQWVMALKNSLDFYHKENLVSEQIDTWQLLETAKVW
tara:strand:+ start:1197 stop:1493 length:297 start_codon:yes stop_codon:yes gene_type:complete